MIDIQTDDRYKDLREYTKPIKEPSRPIVGRQNEIEMILAAFCRPELSNVMLLAEAGTGKAHPVDTWIAVDDDRGYIRIGDIKVGDRVFDECGFPIDVVGVYPQGVLPSYGVEFENSVEIECHENHLWDVRTDKSEAFETMTLSEIMASSLSFGVPIPGAIHRTDESSELGYDKNMYFVRSVYSMFGRYDEKTGYCMIDVPERMNPYALIHSLRMLGLVVWEKDGLFFRGNPLIIQEITGKIEVKDSSFDLKIVDIHKREPKEMICIMVDSPRHLYQIGKEHIVTHNTALVQGCKMYDSNRQYLELDLSAMMGDVSIDANQISATLKRVFDQASHYYHDTGKELVLFMDEFHQVVQFSKAAVEALKPVLADSGTRGLRIIAATTFVEYNEYIAPNQPLVERLRRIQLPEPGKDLVVRILRGMSETYGVSDQFENDYVFEMIYEYTSRYIPANAQPRKSILVLDAMVGWYRFSGRKMDMRLLADVIHEAEGVNVSFRVDATTIKKRLDDSVFSQDFATSTIEDRLQLCIADLNDQTRPMSSFLFTGSTGTGKTMVAKELSKILFESERNLLRFDMTEYSHADSLERFRRELATRVWERPHSIILLDEIEKANPAITRLLLPVLDDARLTDAQNREVSFKNAYIIITTNVAAEIYSEVAHYNASDDGSGKEMRRLHKLIRRSLIETSGDKFPPELLGRIDTIVPFQPLSESTYKKIIFHRLQELAISVKKKHNVYLDVSKRVLPYIAEEKYDVDTNAGGARGLISVFEKEIATPLAAYINANPQVNRVGIDIIGKMAIENKTQLESEAEVDIFKLSTLRR